MSVVLTPAAPPSSSLIPGTINPLDTSVEATFEDSYHRKLSYVGRGRVQVARRARLVSCVGEAGLSVWRIGERRRVDVPGVEKGEEEGERLTYVNHNGADDGDAGSAWEKVLEIELKVHSNIVAHEISDDGKWMVVSDLYESKLFSLRTDVRSGHLRESHPTELPFFSPSSPKTKFQSNESKTSPPSCLPKFPQPKRTLYQLEVPYSASHQTHPNLLSGLHSRLTSSSSI